MSRYASKVISQAKAWIGCKESDGSHKQIIDVYNSHKPLARNYKMKYTDHWCATFVSAVSIKVGYTDIIPTECSCEKMIALFKKLGVWVENENRTPNAGDIIFYDWDDNGKGDNKGWSDHVGIVEKVASGKITIIEGNYSNQVKRRTLSVNGKYIRGYAVPKYDKEVVAKKSIDVIAKEVIDGKWGTGATRKAKLTKAGYNYSLVQAKVNEMLKPKVSYYPKCESKFVSITDALKSIGVTNSFSYRKKIAKANGITLYLGTFSQNTKLLTLLKTGKLKKV